MGRPLVVGVTGGVGSGKSECLEYIGGRYDCVIVFADPEAAKLKKRGEVCFEPLVKLLGDDILGEDGEIDSGRMARRIFADEGLLGAVNAIVHPAVNERIRGIIASERELGARDFVFVEAALLIENGYEETVDEMWYIYADEAVRRERLKSSRGYTDERIDDILSGQLSDAQYREHSAVIIDNGGDLAATRAQIDKLLGERLGGTKRAA